MALESTLLESDKWVLVVENHADGYSALVFGSVVLRNTGSVPIFYSSHQDQPELSHSTLPPGKSVAIIVRHLVVRTDGGDGSFELEVGGLTTVSDR